ncbi:MAG: PrsW family intramembrane metalloprotease [Clostridiales bacterium]|nr:PrsW family intramembrane metalloprotease [Clostridiales bacterium]
MRGSPLTANMDTTLHKEIIMAFIKLVLSVIVVGMLYIRMIRRETPGPISKAQAAVPVALGIASVFLSFACVLGLAAFLGALGLTASALPAIPRSIWAAFVLAGFPEEITKLLMMLLTLCIFRKSVCNVYEYILIGAAVGFGFTIFEEFVYAAASIFDIVGRLVTIAGHMVFGVIMAKHLGLARHDNKPAEYAKAILIPICIHTLYDASTGTSYLLNSEGDANMAIGIVLSIAATAALCVYQIRVLLSVKKDAERYCGMRFE